MKRWRNRAKGLTEFSSLTWQSAISTGAAKVDCRGDPRYSFYYFAELPLGPRWVLLFRDFSLISLTRESADPPRHGRTWTRIALPIWRDYHGSRRFSDKWQPRLLTVSIIKKKHRGALMLFIFFFSFFFWRKYISVFFSMSLHECFRVLY